MLPAPIHYRKLSDKIQALVEGLKTIQMKLESVAENTKPRDKDHGQNDGPPVIVNPELQLPRAALRYYESKAHQAKRWKAPDWVTVLISVLTLIAVSVYACITHSQYIAMLDSNRINADALRSVQRAFIVFGQFMQPNGIAIQGDAAHFEAIEFRPVLENTGSTPAIHATHRSNAGAYQSPMASNFQFPDTDQFAPGQFVLGPRQSFTGASREFPVTILESVHFPRTSLRHLYVYFWGWARYQDVLPGTPEHVTMNCYELADLRSDPSDARSAFAPLWALCPQHNCADHDCDAEPNNPLKTPFVLNPPPLMLPQPK